MVQGVGFRYWTMAKADELGLTGVVRNLDDGSVDVVAEGPHQRVEAFREWLKSDRTPGRVERVEDSITEAEGTFRDFRAR